MSQNDNKTWRVKIVDPEDGSDDCLILLPDDLLKELDVVIGDTLCVDLQHSKISLKKLKLNKG